MWATQFFFFFTLDWWVVAMTPTQDKNIQCLHAVSCFCKYTGTDEVRFLK